MLYVFALLLLLLALLFGLSSISQSYASAQQAQAAIEASRTAQIASTGNLVVVVMAALVIVAFLAAMVLVAWLLLRAKAQPKRQWNSGPNAHWGQVPQPDVSALLPTMLTMLLVQAIQKQNPFETDMLFRSKYEDDLAQLEADEAYYEIPWIS